MRVLKQKLIASTWLFGLIWAGAARGAGESPQDNCRLARAKYGNQVPSVASLGQLAQQHATQYVKPAPGILETARRDLYRALNAMKTSTPHQETWQGWARYLGWNEAVHEFQHDSVTEIDLSKFDKMRRGLFSEYVNEAGFEPFYRARQALEQWIGLISVLQQQDAEVVHHDYLKGLAAGLENPGRQDNRVAIVEALAWLQRSRQYEGLRAAVLCRFSHHNLRIIASERFLERVLSEDLDGVVYDSRPVREWADGAYISGTTNTRGTLGFDVVTNHRQAQIDLVFRGRVETHVSATASQQGVFKTRRYTIPMSFWTDVEGRKPLLLSRSGVSGAGARANANTTSSVSNHVHSNALLGNRRALGTARSSQPQARYGTSATVVGEVETRLNQDARTPIAEAQKGFVEDFRKPFQRKNLGPARLDYHSTEQDVFIDMLMMTDNQVGSHTAIPRLPPSSSDITLVIHQSFASNFSSAFQSGETVTHKDVAVRLADVFGQVPAELDTNSPLAKPWSMTFAKYGGVEFEFNRDRLTLCYRVTDFEVRRQSQNAGFHACASYRYQFVNRAIHFARVGEVTVDITGDADARTEQFMSKKIKAMFLEAFDWQNGISMPGGWNQVGNLVLNQFGVQSGWIWFGYNAK